MIGEEENKHHNVDHDHEHDHQHIGTSIMIISINCVTPIMIKITRSTSWARGLNRY
jgi:hypothetical protein